MSMRVIVRSKVCEPREGEPIGLSLDAEGVTALRAALNGKQVPLTILALPGAPLMVLEGELAPGEAFKPSLELPALGSGGECQGLPDWRPESKP